MKKSFTLIEVVIATMIVLIAATIILSNISNTKHLISIINQKKDFYLKSSIIVTEINNKNKKRKNLYEYLNNFNIDNDTIIKELKKTNYNYKQKEIQYTHFLNFRETISEIRIYNKTNSLKIYLMDIK